MSVSVTIERRLSVPMSEVVELVRKAYAAKVPDDVRVCVDGVKCDVGAVVELCWAVTEAVGPRGG